MPTNIIAIISITIRKALDFFKNNAIIHDLKLNLLFYSIYLITYFSKIEIIERLISNVSK